MKKIVFILIVSFSCLLVSAQNEIRNPSDIRQLDKYLVDYTWDELSDYMNTHYLHFALNDWYYMLSYEPVDDFENMGSREAYMYKKQNRGDLWTKATPNELFTHHYNNSGYRSFDHRRITGGNGSSSLEVIQIDSTDVVVAFIGVQEQYSTKFRLFTHLFVFYPTMEHEDGWYSFQDTEYVFDGVFVVTSREKNKFFNQDGYCVEITHANKPDIHFTDPNGKTINWVVTDRIAMKPLEK